MPNAQQDIIGTQACVRMEHQSYARVQMEFFQINVSNAANFLMKLILVPQQMVSRTIGANTMPMLILIVRDILNSIISRRLIIHSCSLCLRAVLLSRHSLQGKNHS